MTGGLTARVDRVSLLPLVLDIVLVAVAVAFGAALQGAVGLGLGVVAAPLLALWSPELVPGPLLAGAAILSLLLAAREHRAIDLHGVGWALGGRVAGSLLGAAAVSLLPRPWLDVTLGVLLLVCVGLSVSSWRLEPTIRSLLGMGTLSGLTGTAASVGGPPIAVLYQRAAGPRLRATLNGYFLVGTSTSIALLALVGRFGVAELRSTVTRILPGVLAGFLLSAPARPLLDRRGLRPAVLVVSASAAALVLLRGLATLGR